MPIVLNTKRKSNKMIQFMPFKENIHVVNQVWSRSCVALLLRLWFRLNHKEAAPCGSGSTTLVETILSLVFFVR
jgi:hypothetical protein